MSGPPHAGEVKNAWKSLSKCRNGFCAGAILMGCRSPGVLGQNAGIDGTIAAL